MKKMSKIARRLVGQPMFKLIDQIEKMEKFGQEVFHFEIGDTAYDPDASIVQATVDALDAGQFHYVNSNGIAPLRKAICEYIYSRYGYLPEHEQVTVLPANAVIDCVIRCVADESDEVICPDPGFSTYVSVTNYTGVKLVGVPVKKENNFHLLAEDIEKYITSKTRLIIINSPQNPTGAVLTEKEMNDIADLAEKNDLYLLSDEIYSQILYDCNHFSPSVKDKCLQRTIILDGFSKNFAMPGWRLGFAVGPKCLIDKIGLLFQTMFSCLPPFIQYAGIEAFKVEQEVIKNRILTYRHLRNQMVSMLNECPGIECNTPEGANYVFPDITGTGMTSEQFALFALEKAGVALLPGTCFGDNGQGFVRLCFTNLSDIIEKGCDSLRSALIKEGI